MAQNRAPFVVAFSGPPRSGKDSIANELLRQCEPSYRINPMRMQLSLPMREATFALFGLGEYDEATYEKIKDTEIAPGLTLRKAMIDLSEKYIKPAYGKTFWIKSAFHRHQDQPLIIISDLGFEEELMYLSQRVGHANLAIIDVTRDGTTWQGDSRQSLIGMDYHGPRLDIYNNGSIPNAASAVRNYLTRHRMWDLALRHAK